MGERTRKYNGEKRKSFLNRLGGRLEFTPRTLAALFVSGMFTGLMIRGFVPGAYGVSGPGELAQMDATLFSSRVVNSAATEVGAAYSKVVAHDHKTWTMQVTKDGHVLDVTSN
ncbi:MAG TPA: hypothetical protein VGL56_09365 [Fimbriimonadaceae bacterium]|jgi:hypothetical protein